MPRDGVVVWAAITPALSGDSTKPLDLRLARFHQGLCCDGTPPPYTRQWDSAGRSADGSYDVIIRVYFGSMATPTMLASATRAIRALSLPTS